ncbi:MAG: hypothetical protein NZ811_07775 [Gammaproteobacteria bacterium]|nr:hypothetical protein [Gammaproteobacteria bacterium]
MRGNIYICLNEETYNSEIPDLLSRYRRAEYDEEGSLVELLPTTFAQMGEDNTNDFGVVRDIKINGDNFYILEFDGSWLNGEVSYLLNLGDELAYPNNSLLTRQEARKLLKESTVEL